MPPPILHKLRRRLVPPFSNYSHLPSPPQPIPAATVPPDPALDLQHHLHLCRSVPQARPILARLVVAGTVHRVVVLRHLVEFLAFSADHPSSLLIARLLSKHYFHNVPNSTTFLYNTLIRGYSKSRIPGESISTFVRMLRSGACPDNFTFPFVIKASAWRNSSREGEQTHGQVIKWGFVSDIYVINTLISMFSVFGDMGSARKLFDLNAEALDAVSWNTIIDGYVKDSALEEARKLFDEMPVKNDVSWSAMISGYAGSGELDVAQSLFDRMPVAGRNVVTWNSMVSGFARQGFLLLARKLFDEMPVRNVVSWNAMISGYALNGQMDLAWGLFEQMPEKDVVSWSSMISGYAQSSRYKEALNLFKEMQMEKKIMPNEVTMVSVLSACAHLAALDQGKWIHAYIERNQMRLDDDDNLGAALIDMYAKCGSVDAAAELFSKLDYKNVSAWNALITGLAINGLSRKSLDVFRKMQSTGTKPNDVTFVGVMTSCTHGGLVDEGKLYFESMSKDYGIQPEMKHYGCLVDLLGRAGLLADAEGVIRNMPMKPDVIVLGALLGACRIHRDVKIADRLRDHVLELKSREAGCHVLLSNIYAAAGRWTDASEIRRILKNSGIRKEPGSSSVEMDGTVYEFVAGDHSHPKTTEIYSWLDEMCLKLRSEGYSPATEDVLLDLSEEDKETWLSRHSEKLAVAFAMLKAAPNSTIRIVKNLRICGDCHSFIKHVSRSCSREILVRDRTRFHHFKAGLCSCGDFW